ncbi:hypothetical protein PVAG01_06527 [Phlyctema vagabunda]|uniref:Uncharacterized protein n=1 Tax=Phlyctema vagabunda TaxID=108571 RepID=A0ABR4PGB4_9HELO
MDSLTLPKASHNAPPSSSTTAHPRHSSAVRLDQTPGVSTREKVKEKVKAVVGGSGDGKEEGKNGKEENFVRNERDV